MSKATIYRNMKDMSPNEISVNGALKRIKEGKSKETVEKIRSGEDLKKDLPAVVFAGLIKNKTRKDKDVEQHSGYFVCDFDHVDIAIKRSQLQNDSYVYAVWVSPSGDGLKCLVKCPPALDKHEQYYNAFLSRYPELDSTSKNIARLCFESYDPDLWINYNSLVWDKTLTDEQFNDWKDKRKNKRKQRALDITASMIRTSRDNHKHDDLLKAANLLGGYVAVGVVDEGEAIKHLEEEIKKKPNVKSLADAKKTIREGIEYGKMRPLNEAKEIENSLDFTRRSDGSYDFLADDAEMDEYEYRFINGLLEMGLPTGMPKLDQHWLFKRNTLVWIGGISNIGKSFSGWYLAVLAAMFHDWKFLVYSKENRDGQVRKKLKEFYIGKSIKLFTEDELQMSDEFIKQHFKLFTAKKMHTMEDFLLKCEIVFDEGWGFDCVFAEPYNAFDIPLGTAVYPYNTHVLNKLQTFKENFSAIWISDHVNTNAARDKDKDGFIKAPWKSDIEMGAMKDNKSDDFLILHRHTQDPAREKITEVHVQKIKDRETGGKWTPIDEPVELIANDDLCGFSCNLIDPVANYWTKKKGVTPPLQQSTASSRLGGWEKDSSEPPF